MTQPANDPATARVRQGAALHHLVVRDFRNVARLECAPPPEGMAVVGENGQGKTNLLEAIYYLQLQRSFRGARDSDLVRFGEDGFHIAADVSGGRAGRTSVRVGFEREGRRKKVVVAGVEVDRLSDAIGVLPAVIFSPGDVALVNGGPGERRRYLDILLALTSRSYLHALQRYREALARRNAALRSGGDTDVMREANAAVWEPALATHGATIWRERAGWATAQAPAFAESCAAIGERGSASLRLSTAWSEGDDPESVLRDALERRRRVDLQRGITHSGPHRDDVALHLESRELRTFGSAGQQRTAAIALRLLESATIRQALGSEPLILLDDPFAELDVQRSARILELLDARGAGTTILAVPREHDIPPGLTRLERWRMHAGELRR